MTHDPRAQDPRTRLTAAVASSLEGRMLLTHPFYRRWEAGELTSQELAEYAVHYRAFEAVLPAVLAAVVDAICRAGAERLVANARGDQTF